MSVATRRTRRPTPLGATSTPAGGPVELLVLPAGKIVPSIDNPRRDLGDLTELAASIAGVGLLEPLVVARPTPAAPGVYPLVAGHRRLVAAQLAGLSEIPCVVRDMSPAEQLEAMLVENLQRTDLSALEEAGAYGRLTRELGLTQRVLGQRIGRSQSHIAKRLALLELPEDARSALDSGGITLEEAWTLTRLAAHPDRLAVALGAQRYSGGVKGEAERQLREIEDEAKRETLTARLRAEGTKVLPTPNRRTLGREAALQQADMWSWSYSAMLPFTIEAHAGEECHAGIVHGPRWDGKEAEVFWVCTSPGRHAEGGKSALKLPKGQAAGKRVKSPQEEAADVARKASQAAAKARREFMVHWLENASASQLQEAIPHVLRMLLVDANHGPAVEACRLLGIDPLVSTDRYGATHRGYREALAQASQATTPHALARTALALVLGLGEDASGYSLTYDKPRTHLAWLQAAGYEPGPWETEQLARTGPGDGDEALREDDEDDVPACRVCGCTEDEPCAGGCHWVPDPEIQGDLCSACLPELPSASDTQEVAP